MLVQTSKHPVATHSNSLENWPLDIVQLWKKCLYIRKRKMLRRVRQHPVYNFTMSGLHRLSKRLSYLFILFIMTIAQYWHSNQSIPWITIVHCKTDSINRTPLGHNPYKDSLAVEIGVHMVFEMYGGRKGHLLTL